MSISELDRSDDASVAHVAVPRRPAPPADLYDAGQEAVDEVLRFVDATGAAAEGDRALDFGCGIGHTAQALTRHFRQVDGVELSSSMVELAESYNSAGDRCRYHLHRVQHLGLFDDGTFDLVFTDAALHHLKPDNQLRFISEFLRVLRPDGVAVFDVATRFSRPMQRLRSRVTPRSTAKRCAGEGGPFCLRAAEVRLQVELLGAHVVADRPLSCDGIDRQQFVAQK